MIPVFEGSSVADCPYCRDAIYPHNHDFNVQSKSVARRKAAIQSKADPTIPKRPRGRPPTPETLDLFRTCTCNKNSQP